MRSPNSIWGTLSLMAAAFLLGSTFIFLGCEGDEGPTGPAGPAGTAECFECHTDQDTQFIIAREVQWEHSMHAMGGTFARNTIPCADCHTSEGFVHKLNTGSSMSPENPSPVGCFTCHAPHTEGNFELRTTAPVPFIHNGGTYDYAASNLCANCHQGRPLSPEIAAPPDSTTLTSNRWGPHHSTQGNLLAGRGGYEFVGFNYNNSYHTIGVDNGCITCHMAAPYGAQAGGHQMGLVYGEHGDESYLVAGCNDENCHGNENGGDGLEDFNRPADGDHDGDGTVEGTQDEVAGLLALLQAELFARGFIDDENLVIASRTEPLKLSAAEAGAIFNYLYVLEDQSLGIHNTNYAVGLLQSALSNLPE